MMAYHRNLTNKLRLFLVSKKSAGQTKEVFNFIKLKNNSVIFTHLPLMIALLVCLTFLNSKK